MKRLFYTTLICLLFIPATAQRYCQLSNGDTINCIDESGLRQGRWKNLDHRVKYILDEGMYVDGKKEGVWNDYYPNGKLKFTVTFRNGMPAGKAASYYATGQMSEQGNFERGCWTGEYTIYYLNGCILGKTVYDKEGFRISSVYYGKDSCGVLARHPGRVRRSYTRILPRRLNYELDPPQNGLPEMDLKKQYQERKKKDQQEQLDKYRSNDMPKLPSKIN